MHQNHTDMITQLYTQTPQYVVKPYRLGCQGLAFYDDLVNKDISWL